MNLNLNLPPYTLVESASCAQTDPDAFFPEKGNDTRLAKRVCAGCLVRVQCLTWSLENPQRYGVWGGLSERERRKLTNELPVDIVDEVD